jgi:hypothetical protein
VNALLYRRHGPCLIFNNPLMAVILRHMRKAVYAKHISNMPCALTCMQTAHCMSRMVQFS